VINNLNSLPAITAFERSNTGSPADADRQAGQTTGQGARDTTGSRR